MQTYQKPIGGFSVVFEDGRQLATVRGSSNEQCEQIIVEQYPLAKMQDQARAALIRLRAVSRDIDAQ